MRVGRGKMECVVVATSAATYHAPHFYPTNRIHKYIYKCTVRQILVARIHLLVRRHREEQLQDAAVVPARWIRKSFFEIGIIVNFHDVNFNPRGPSRLQFLHIQ
jgi:hypothetical protein